MTLRSLLTGLRNLAYWLPVIWHDRQWDQYYLVAILQHKLAAMERHFATATCRADGDKVAQRIRYCCILCDRLLADEYGDRARVPVVAKWGESVHWLESEPGSPSALYCTAWPNATTPEQEERARRDWLRAAARAHRQQLADYRALGAALGRWMGTWWD